MGYYTDYELTASYYRTGNQNIPKDISDRLADRIEEMEWFEAGGSPEDGYYVNAKWYSNKEDMCKLSSEFPTVLFCLSGEGESNGDLWKAYFLNGKFQYCPAQITYDDFDLDKLM